MIWLRQMRGFASLRCVRFAPGARKPASRVRVDGDSLNIRSGRDYLAAPDARCRFAELRALRAGGAQTRFAGSSRE
jgi:hypothetical protein